MLATVGVFDGVHAGHRRLLRQMRRQAPDSLLCVVTFTDHPMRVIAPAAAPKLITLADDKTRLLGEAGADMVVMLDFADIRPLTARQFMRRLADAGVAGLVLGFNNRFGSDRLTNLAQYQAVGAEFGVEVSRGEALIDGGAPVSSTRIRALISDGDMAEANRLLGAPMAVSGTVGPGRQLGRTIGYPTANIITDPRQLLPAPGVYAATARLGGRTYPVMANIGARPTVDDDPRPTFEAHIIGYDADLYGERLTVSPLSRIRPTRRFDSIGALRRQLDLDREAVLAMPAVGSLIDK